MRVICRPRALAAETDARVDDVLVDPAARRETVVLLLLVVVCVRDWAPPPAGAAPEPPPPPEPLADGAAAVVGVPEPLGASQELSAICTTPGRLDVDGFAPECCWSRQASVWPLGATIAIAVPPVGELVGPTETMGVALRAATAVHASATTLMTNPAETMRPIRRPTLMLSAISSSLVKVQSNSRGPQCPRTDARIHDPAENHSIEGDLARSDRALAAPEEVRACRPIWV